MFMASTGLTHPRDYGDAAELLYMRLWCIEMCDAFFITKQTALILIYLYHGLIPNLILYI